jgi:hypothetical protein
VIEPICGHCREAEETGKWFNHPGGPVPRSTAPAEKRIGFEWDALRVVRNLLIGQALLWLWVGLILAIALLVAYLA